MATGIATINFGASPGTNEASVAVSNNISVTPATGVWLCSGFSPNATVPRLGIGYSLIINYDRDIFTINN